MKSKVAFSVLFSLILLSCQNRFYSEGDFTSVLKIDSHVHINTDKGYFEDQAKQDNFLLVTLNVDHSDSANIKKQLDYALLSTQKHPDLKFIGCHLGSLEWNVDSLAKRLDKFPNMVVDKIYSENAIKWYKLYPPAPQMGG